MVGVELEGFEETLNKFRHLSDNWNQVIQFATKRAVQVFEEILSLDSNYIHPVKVEDRGVCWYGLSLEPEPEPMKLEDILEHQILFIQINLEDVPEEYEVAAKGNPWVPDLIPAIPEEEEGFIYLRNSSEDEVEQVRKNNTEYLQKNSITPIGDPSAESLFQEDVKYNIARAEFGIGPSQKSKEWRPSVDELLEDKMQIVLDDVIETCIEGDIPEVDMEFEERSVNWLEEHQDFMLQISQ